MRPTLIAIIFSLTLLLPTAMARPREVQADCVGADIPLAIVTLGILYLANGGDSVCKSFGEASPEDPYRGCLIGDVGATAKLDANGLSHGYDYRLAGDCGNVRVQAGYAFKGGEAAERLEGNGRTVRATWYCSDDPWVHGSGERPSCSRIAINVTGANADAYAVAASKLTYPLSAGVLAPISRQTLNGQVENAEKQARANAAKPAPAPASKVVTPPQTSPVVALISGIDNAPYVEALQYLLRHHGLPVEVDGDFGPQTYSAVTAFQVMTGQSVSGIVDLKIWELLWVTIGIGANGDAVSAAQTLLNAHGFDVEVDGDFGPQTRDVVRHFQTSKGLIVGGVVDEKIWRALVAPPAGP